MLLNRQKRLLALLAAHAGQLGHMDFQKLLFLYCLEVETRPSYDFVPYRFGGFSFTSYADKRRLTKEGLLDDQERVWKLTAYGEKTAGASIPSTTKAEMKLFASRYGSLRGDALVANVYRKYPYYAIRSEIASRVLKSDKVALRAIKGASPVRRAASLCTIGYEGLSVEAYLNKLLVASVTLLCDVRKNPLSRKYGFSRAALERNCESIGIRYEHLPELGIASERRRNLVTEEERDTLFSSYRKDTLPRERTALGKLCTWIGHGHRVALTCYEHAPHQCHRHCIAEYLEQRLGCIQIVDHL